MVKAIVFDDSAGQPANLLGASGGVALPPQFPPQWHPFALTLPLAAGVYWIGTHGESNFGIAYQSVIGYSKFKADVFADGTDTTWGAAGQTYTMSLSVYVEYSVP